jgi:DNA-binding response OmpR family regulator
MKKLPEFQELPVIMVTARDEDGDVLEGYRYGADYYICKPFTAKQLEKGIALYLADDEGSPE